MFLRAFYKKRLKAAREADQVRAQTEARTLACRHSDSGCESVEQRECGEGRHTDGEDLTEGGLLGVEHKHRDERDNKALD